MHPYCRTAVCKKKLLANSVHHWCCVDLFINDTLTFAHLCIVVTNVEILSNIISLL